MGSQLLTDRQFICSGNRTGVKSDVLPMCGTCVVSFVANVPFVDGEGLVLQTFGRTIIKLVNLLRWVVISRWRH